MFDTSSIELSKSALQNNVRFLRHVIGEQVRFSAVVKGNAYGHGIEAWIPLAETCDLHHFSVFSADEAYRVQKVCQPGTTIMIMGMIGEDQLEWAVEKNVEFYVFNLSRLESACRAAERVGKAAIIHVELETGMNRTGFNRKQLKEAVLFMKEHHDCVKVKGLCTHFAGAESIANYKRVQDQIRRFRRTVSWWNTQSMPKVQLHSACSAAAISLPSTRMDMVRFGISQYGFWSSDETRIGYLTKHRLQQDPLQRVLTWKSRVMSTKQVKTGEFIGYGPRHLAQHDMTIATIPVGYSHGYSRSLSDFGHVLIHGERVPVIGLINMNVMTVDTSHLSNVKQGDEVVLIGSQGDRIITVASFGQMSNQLNYELLTCLPDGIPRQVVD